MIWITISIFMFFTVLLIYTSFLVVFDIFPSFILRKNRKYNDILDLIGLTITIIFIIQIIASIFLIETYPQIINRIFSYSPVTAPLYIPMKEAHYFLNDPEYSPLLAVKIGLMITLSSITTYLYLKYKPVFLADPLFPPYQSIKEKKEMLTAQSSKRKSCIEFNNMDLWYSARKNVRQAEFLNAFRPKRGPDSILFLDDFFLMKGQTNEKMVMRGFCIIGLFFILSVIGAYFPFILFIAFFCLFSLGFDIIRWRMNDSWEKQSFIQLLKQLPISNAVLERNYYNQKKSNYMKKMLDLSFFYITIFFTSICLSLLLGIKIHVLRLLIIYFIVTPFLVFCCFPLADITSENPDYKVLIFLIAFFDLLIFNFIWVGSYYFYDISWVGICILIFINCAFRLLYQFSKRDYFDTFYERISDSFRKKEKCCALGIIIIMLFSIYSMHLLANTDYIIDDPHYYEFDENPLTENLSNRDIIFTHDVVITSNITIENCTVKFSDNYFNDLHLFVKRAGNLSIRNTTICAQYYFHFWVSGNLLLDNVTIKDLYGSNLNPRHVEGMFIWGNAIIRNSTIMESESMGIYILRGNLTVDNSSIIDCDGYGIRASSSKVNITNCIFKGNSYTDIYLYNCTGTVSGCTFDNENESAVTKRNSPVEMEENTFGVKDNAADFPWKACFFWGLIIIGIILCPLLLIQHLDNRDWDRLEKKYGIKWQWKEMMDEQQIQESQPGDDIK